MSILFSVIVSLKKKQYPDDEYVPPDGYASSAAPLNFKSLFSDQPAADYYPVSPWSRPATRPGTIPSDYEQNANTVGRILEKKIDISALPPPTRLNTAPIMGMCALLCSTFLSIYICLYRHTYIHTYIQCIHTYMHAHVLL